jgi:tetratricopeptide (TPR) repeat protein
MEDFPRAESAGREVLEIQRRWLGEDHPECAVAVNNLAVVHHQAGRLGTAEELYGEACATLRKAPGMTRQLLGSLANLELLYRQRGEEEKADALLAEVEELRLAAASLASSREPDSQ